MSHLQEFFRIPPGERDHIPAFRIALGVAVPLLVLLGIDRLDLAVYAAFGAFTGIYARFESRRSRTRRQSIAAAVLVICVGIGALLSSLGASVWVLVVITSLVSGAGAAIALRFRLKPGGSIFFIFATGAVGSIPGGASVPVAMGVAAASALVCIGLGALAHFAGERMPPEKETYVRVGLSPVGKSDLAAHAARFTIAPFIAGILGTLLIDVLPLLSHSYWAMVAAVAPITPPGRSARLKRGVQRVVGTLLGVIVTAFLLSFPTEAWQLVVWVILLQFLAEIFVLRNYSVALLFITPLALLMTQIGAPHPVPELLASRAIETVIGAAVGMIVVIVGFSHAKKARTEFDASPHVDADD
ncbi:FUSC family protein [Brevibacterium sp. 'Marine']|uniref:FUSC family protein n=1 Tax=Brevibacterium sp. 'Marine' TaxID=2725563 RepID=UPI00145EFE02|nr:FUSC family protein [Brevibacterium sp. 'Marine']